MLLFLSWLLCTSSVIKFDDGGYSVKLLTFTISLVGTDWIVCILGQKSQRHVQAFGASHVAFDMYVKLQTRCRLRES